MLIPRYSALRRITRTGFRFGLPLLSSASLLTLQAQSTPPNRAATSDEVVAMNPVVSVGSRFNERTVIDSAVPIDIVTKRDLTSGGYTETSQMLQAMVPSFNFPRATIADGTDHIRPATLRGLAPDQVLVLVNGKRRHTSSLVNVNGTVGRGSVSVDLNAIPPAAIQRIEVLRDGASAQYGSDAIAGVINVVLDKSLGYGASAQYGVTSEGDGQVIDGSVFGGTPFGEKGVFHTTLFYRDRDGTDRSEPDTRQQYFGTSTTTGAPTAISGNFASGTTNPPVNVTLDPREATIDRQNHWQGDSEIKDRGGFIDAELPLAEDGATVYGFGGYTKRDGKAAGFFRRAGDDRTVRALWPNGFLPKINTDITDKSIGAGLRTKDLGWDLDLSTVYGSNELDYTITDTNNVTLGNASPTHFYAGHLEFNQWTTNLDLSRGYDVGLNSPLNVAVGGEYRWEQYTIGAGEPDSYRDGGVRIVDGPNAGALGAPGAQVFPGFRPSDAVKKSRNSYAVYTDFENQITAQLLLSLAARYEDYSNFGAKTTGKLSGRYKFTDALAARASVSTGFRAPHLAQSWFSSTATNFIGGLPFENKTFPVSDPVAIALGASALKPETSVNTSVGLTWEQSGLTASVDFYRIEIDDRIVLSSNFTGAAVINFLNAQGLFGTTGGRYFTNAVDTRTQGVDLNTRYRFNFATAGSLTATAGININDTKVTHFASTPPQLAAIGVTTPLFDILELVRMEEGQPKNIINVALTYDWKKWSVMLRNVRYGEVAAVATGADGWSQARIDALTPGYKVRLSPPIPGSPAGNQVVTQTFDAKWITDLDLTYRITRKLSVAIGANNLFAVYPTKNIASTSAFLGADNAGIFPYNGISPWGFNGTFWYGKLNVAF